MEGSGKLNCDNQNTPTLHTPPTPTSTNFSMSCTSLSNTSSIISRTWVTPQVFPDLNFWFDYSFLGGGGGGYHCFQREWRGEQWSLTEFKGGTKENRRPMKKIDRIIRNVMEGSGKLYCDNQNTPTLHTPPPPPLPTSTNFSIMLSTLLNSTSSIISRTWVMPQVFRS